MPVRSQASVVRAEFIRHLNKKPSSRVRFMAGVSLFALTTVMCVPANATPINWASDVNGSFNDPTRWTGGVVPVSTDDVTINTGTAGTPDTITSSTSNSIKSLTTGAHDTLASTGGTFAISNGGTNAGTISVGNNTAFQLGGTLNNSGALTLNSSGNTTSLQFANGAKLTGGGKVTLSDNSANVVFGITNSATEVVTNVDNTISGAGTWGYSNSIGTINQSGGVFDANGLTSLVITPTTNSTVVTANGGGFVNQGLMEATNTGGLELRGGIFNNTGGTIKAVGTGNNVYLEASTTIVGGTLNGSGGGVIETAAGQHANLDGATSGQITLSGTYLANNNTGTTITGTFNNLGTFSLAAAANTTSLQFADGTMLTGGGHIALSDSTANVVYGVLNNALETVTNVNNTISGAGTLGYSNGFEFINQAGGTIDANGTSALIVQPGSNIALVAANHGGFVNQNLMEATNTGGLVLNGGIFNNQTGTIKAAAAGDNVYLQSNVTIRGGTLDGSGGGMFETVTGHNAVLDGSTLGQIILKGTYLANNNSGTNIYGTFNNQGTFSLAGAANSTVLHLADGTTLTGGGNITLSDSASNLVFGVTNDGTETVTDVNNKISGAGTIGYSNGFEFINQTVINANGLTALIVQPTANAALIASHGGGFVNQNLMEATNTGGLVLNGGIFNNQAGTIKATAAGDNVYLQSSVTVRGGTLDASGGGMFETVAGHNVSLDGSTLGQIILKGTYLANNNSSTYISGTFDNQGTFSLAGAGNTTVLHLADGAILTGGGNITLSDSTGNLVFGVTNNGAETVTNVNNIITGAGTLGYSNGLEFFNQAAGVIDANGTHTLHVLPASGSLVATNNGGFVNLGLMEATNSGGMALDGGIFNNAGGTIKAVGTGNNVYLEGNTTVRGGTLNGSGGGIVETVGGQVASLDGATVGQITILGNYLADNNSTTYLNGTINNQGTFKLNATGNATYLRITDGTTLTGGGTVVLSDNSSNIVFGVTNSGSEIFTNVDNTIQGAGLLGYSNGLKIVNGGTIDANGANALIIQPTTVIAVGTALLNQSGGVLEGSGAGGLSIATGIVDNQGSVLALNGSSVTYQAPATTLNNSGGTLTGGTWGATSTGGGATVSINGTPVVTDAANIVLSGAGSVFQVRNGNTSTFTPLENSLTTIASTGQLQILGNRNYTTNTASNDIANAGSLALGGGTFTAKDVTNTGLVTGFGTITTTAGTQLANSGGTVHATGGTLTVTPGISGPSGNIAIDSGAGLNLSPASTGSQVATLTDSGAINLGAHNITVFADYNNTNFGVGNSFNKHANVATTGGQILAAGTTSQTLSGVGSGATATPTLNFGNVHVGSSATIDYQINNVGTGGPSLRFAIQTGTNGGNITDSRLSGTGVTPSNIGPVAQGSSSAPLAITFTANSGGALTGQTVHIENNFDNVNGQTLSVSGTAYNLAKSSTIAPISFGLHHVGDGPITQTLSITNTAPAGSFSEGLDSSFGSFTGTGGAMLSTSGSITNLAAGASDTTSMAVTLSTATAGNVNGTLTVHQASNGSGTSNLGITALSDQNPAVTAQVAQGTVVRFASPLVNNAPINFGNVRIGTAVTPQGISVTNNVPNDGFSESLIGNVVGTSNSQVTASGGFGPPTANPEVAPAATNATNITAAIDTSSAGAKSGNAIVDFKSDGTMFQGGSITDLGNTNVAVQGNVYRLASPTLDTPSVTLAARVGQTSPSAGVGVTNTSPDAFTEGLDAGISTSSTGFTATGTISNLAAQAGNSSSLKVGLDTSTSGSFTGNATVSYTSNGLIDNATAASAGTGSVALTGKVYQTAVASVTPGSLDFGIVHVGDTVAAKSINVANTASGALTDVITGSIGSVTGGAFTSSGTLGAGVAAGSNSDALQVGLNTSTAGNYSGQANLALKSHDGDLVDATLATTPEAVIAQINNYAKGAIKDTGGAGTLSGGGASYVLDFGKITQGSGTKVADLAVKNDVSGPADLLSGKFTVTGLPSDLTLSGFDSFSGLAAGALDSGLMASFDTGFAPSFFDVFVTLDLTGSNPGGYNGALPTDPTITLELRGTIVSSGGGGNVPEPGTLALLGGGLAGLFAAARRRRKARPAA